MTQKVCYGAFYEERDLKSLLKRNALNFIIKINKLKFESTIIIN